MQFAFVYPKGSSIFDSQGNQDAMNELAGLTSRLQNNEDKDIRTPLGKADILLKSLQIVRGWCDIGHLGVRSVGEEFHDRFEENFVKKKQRPRLELGLGVSLKTRIVPLYAPDNSTQNSLTFYEDIVGVQPTTQTYRLLFSDDKGKPFFFKVCSKIKGNMIEFPHEVIASYFATEKHGLVPLLAAHPLVLDWCLRSIVNLGLAAEQRAQERINAVKNALFSVRMIAGMTRKGDLETAICLMHEDNRGMTPPSEKIKSFRRIVEMAGATTEERMKRLEEVLKNLNWRGMSSLSGLPLNATLAIIRGEQVEG